MIVFKKREFNPANVTKEEARSIMGPHAEITDSGVVALTWHIAWVRNIGQVHISIDNCVFATRFVGKDLHINRASNDFSPGGYFTPRWRGAALIAFSNTHWAGIAVARDQDYLCRWSTMSSCSSRHSPSRTWQFQFPRHYHLSLKARSMLAKLSTSLASSRKRENLSRRWCSHEDASHERR